MSESVLGIIWLGWTIALLILYHKVFAVYYFDLANGLLKEIIGAALLGVIMTAVTLMYWYISAIIIIIIGLAISNKVRSKVPLIIAIICAIIVAVVGIQTISNSDTSSASNKVLIENQHT